MRASSPGGAVVVSCLVLTWLASGHAGQAPVASAACSRTWPGHEPAIEHYLGTAAIIRMDAVPIGVTKPQRGTFVPGGVASRFAWKALPPARRAGFAESYKAEIAAYHLDRLLGLEMVPPVVERTIDGRVGAAVLWIEDALPWSKERPPAGPEPAWSRQISRMKLFDHLIANIDRNAGNLLYDHDWHLFLIDHSRAFTTRTSFDGLSPFTTVDRRLWQVIDGLTPDDVRRTLGAWLTDKEQQALLIRRDRLRGAIERLVRQRGAGQVFF